MVKEETATYHKETNLTHAIFTPLNHKPLKIIWKNNQLEINQTIDNKPLGYGGDGGARWIHDHIKGSYFVFFLI